MMKRKCMRLCIGILFFLMACVASAQRLNSTKQINRKYFANVVAAYSDYLDEKTTQYWLPDSTGRIYQVPVELNPIYYRLFTPITIYHTTVSNAMNGLLVDTLSFDVPDRLLPLRQNRWRKDRQIMKMMDRALVTTYLNTPLLVKQTEDMVMGQRGFNEDIIPTVPRRERITKIVEQPVLRDLNVKQRMKIRKPNFWTQNLNVYLQFTQNYISDNWYKGGESSNSFLSGLTATLNYDDQQRIQFDNTLEWKLGFMTSRSDTLHKYKPNSDLIRLTSKLGVKAVSSWYYTIQTELSTQFFSSYETNSEEKVSSFLAPAYLKIDLGMDFKKSLDNLTLSALLSPCSYKLTYVGDDKVDETDFGVEEGKVSKNSIGSNIQITSKWTIVKNVVWESRLSYYTTYENVQAEWENTFSFQLNRYISTKLFVHGRFDDSVTLDEDDHSYFQLNELLSFGLSYDF